MVKNLQFNSNIGNEYARISERDLTNCSPDHALMDALNQGHCVVFQESRREFLLHLLVPFNIAKSHNWKIMKIVYGVKDP